MTFMLNAGDDYYFAVNGGESFESSTLGTSAKAFNGSLTLAEALPEPSALYVIAIVAPSLIARRRRSVWTR
jgi:hypothetical protein